MNKPKIYIAGKVSGEKLHACTMKFGAAQVELEKLGFETINPLEIVPHVNVPWQTAMRMCICKLMCCHGIFLLKDHEQSKGARIERELANHLGIPEFKSFKDLTKFQWKSNS